MAMQVFCPRCERSYHRGGQPAGEPILCSCGARFYLPAARRRRRRARRRPRPGARAASPSAGQQRPDPEQAAALRACSRAHLLGRRADELCRMILNPHASEVDIAMERHRLRALAERLFPDQMELYEMIFESRFERLTQQFRSPERRAG